MINTANAKGILFSTAMVKAIQEERKTQTRRVVKYTYRDVLKAAGNPYPEGSEKKWTNCPSWMAEWYVKEVARPRYKVGDILYVRETWAPCATIDSWLDDVNLYIYKTDFPDDFRSNWKWRSPRYMPKEAARLWLEVTGVKVERVQDITEQDARAEGCSAEVKHFRTIEGNVFNGSTTAKQAFAELWDSINAKPKPVYRTVDGRKVVTHYESYPWEAVQETREHRGKEWRVYGNPWVRVYTFRDVSREVEKDGA